MREPWNDVCLCDIVGEPRHVEVACVHGKYGSSIRKCDGQWCCGNSLINDVCGVSEEMPGGSRVAECIVSRGSVCFSAVHAFGHVGEACPVGVAVVGVIVIVMGVIVIVHETRIKVVRVGCCGGVHRRSGIDTIISRINCYFYFDFPCPFMPSLLWPGIGGHNHFVNGAP